jgi:hypothetical protein
LRGLNGIWKVFEKFGIFGAGQRRGTHVSVPKIGSRAGLFCIGGILRNHAELRREFCWGNLKLEFFEGLPGGPRSATEEGGTVCVSPECLGEL